MTEQVHGNRVTGERGHAIVVGPTPRLVTPRPRYEFEQRAGGKGWRRVRTQAGGARAEWVDRHGELHRTREAAGRA